MDISYEYLTTNVISTIRVWVEDEEGRFVNFNNEALTVELKLIRTLRTCTSSSSLKRSHKEAFVLERFG